MVSQTDEKRDKILSEFDIWPKGFSDVLGLLNEQIAAPKEQDRERGEILYPNLLSKWLKD